MDLSDLWDDFLSACSIGPRFLEVFGPEGRTLARRWKYNLLQRAMSGLGTAEAIEIETSSHGSAVALRKDLGSIATRRRREAPDKRARV